MVDCSCALTDLILVSGLCFLFVSFGTALLIGIIRGEGKK